MSLPFRAAACLLAILTTAQTQYIFVEQALNFTEAQAYCESEEYQSDLASIHSDADNDAATDLCINSANRCWIGLHDRDVEDTFVWTDGSDFDYGTNISGGVGPWANNNPNNVGGNEDCVHFDGGNYGYQWSDLQCSQPHSFICNAPTRAPSQLATRDPTGTPTQGPTMNPTHTPHVAIMATMNPTDLPTAPSALPSNSEYGVDITIKLDAVLPQNETDELFSALREYARNTANVTNCSERINVSSQQTEDDRKTVMRMSIVTCSEATEKQLLVAFDETVLVYDIIGGVVTEAEVDAIEIEGIYADSTAQTVPADDVEKKRYWYLILLAVLLLIAGVVVFWFVWRRKKSHDERKDVDRNMANAVELQKCDSNAELGKVYMDRKQRAVRVTANATVGSQANVQHPQDNGPEVVSSVNASAVVVNDDDDDDDQDNDDLFGTYEQGATTAGDVAGAASFSRAEGDVAGVIGMGGDHDGNLAHVGSVDMSNEPITAEGDDEPILVLQQPQTVFIA